MGSSDCSKPKETPSNNNKLNSSNDKDIPNISDSSNLLDNQDPLKSEISLNSTNDDIIPNANSLIKEENIYKNNEKKNEIKKILKVVVPMKSRKWALTGQIFLSMTPLAYATVPLLQGVEHHGLIIEVDNGYYYTHYIGKEVCLNYSKNKEEIMNEMIDCCSHYDSRDVWTYEKKYQKIQQ